MNKKARLQMIRKTYHDTRRKRRKLTPKTWQLIKELREEQEVAEQPDMVFDFSQDDIYEEIQLMNGVRRFENDEADWDNSRYYDSNLSSEILYFRGAGR